MKYYMERAIAEMEKIKRAEEIYSRRRNAEESEKNLPSKNIYKFLFETIFIINVVTIIIAVQNQKYIFTENFLKQVNEYNVNIKSKVEEFMNSSNDVKNNTESKELSENIKEENKSVSGESKDVNGALVENEVQEEKSQDNISQEEKDIDIVKNNYSVILPINGTKTSGFGERKSNNKKVTKFHTGIDLATEQGTIIKSATSGKVIQVSDIGDYGKHVKVQTEDLIILYAHCSKIYVIEGQEINQGDEIGEVGSTGNSTGPHLHFEIRLFDRLINPEKIISI